MQKENRYINDTPQNRRLPKQYVNKDQLQLPRHATTKNLNFPRVQARY